MKLRLFCFLSAIFMIAGLLLPSGVYAATAPSSEPTVNVDVTGDVDDTANPEACHNSAQTASIEAVDAETAVESETTDNPNQCPTNGNGEYSQVSWNS